MIRKLAKATMGARAGDYRFEDFCALVGDGQKADLINGAIYMASPDNIIANKLCLWLVNLISFFVDDLDLGDVFVSRVALRLDDLNSPEPDIVFLSKEHRSRIRRGFILGAADLAIEIVSPDSVERDYETKRLLYEAAGIPEYWIIDEFKRRITLHRLDNRGKYREVRAQKGIFRSQVIAGFWLDASWLWQQPLPSLRKTLKLIEG
jgi:Uma2 family endonuclease